MAVVNTIEWMLTHQGIAIAKVLDNDKRTVEIIEHSKDARDYPKFKEIANRNGYIVVVGKGTEGENRLGYFRD